MPRVLPVMTIVFMLDPSIKSASRNPLDIGPVLMDAILLDIFGIFRSKESAFRNPALLAWPTRLPGGMQRSVTLSRGRYAVVHTQGVSYLESGKMY